MIAPSLRGFSLIEVLVALTIFAFSASVIYQIFGTGLRLTAVGDGYTRATVHAKSQLALLGVEHPLDTGLLSGKLKDGFRWEANVAPYVPVGEAPLDAPSGLEPLTVQMRVLWTSGGKLRAGVLDTVRLKAPVP